jgi:single-strand DNA-binding protein
MDVEKQNWRIEMQSNRFELTGYIATAPAGRRLPSGTPVANVRLGQTYQYQTKDGSNKHTNWFSLSFYGELSTVALTYEKGDNIHVIGTIQQRQFTPKDGATRNIYEVVVQKCHRIARHAVAQQTPADAVTEQSLQTAPEDAKAVAQEEVDAWAVL